MKERYIKRRWESPEKPGSFSALSGFLKASPQFKDKNFVEKVLSDLHSYSVHVPRRKQWKRRRIITAFPGITQAIDLGDLSKYARQNNNYKWIMLLCDVFSKFIWCYKLKDKSAISILEALKIHFKKKSNIPRRIWGDKGLEFWSKSVRSYLESHGVTLYSTASRLKSVYAEVYLKILKTKLERYFTFSKTKRWVDVLDKLVLSLNSTPNSRTKFAPKDINLQNASIAWNNQYKSVIEIKKRKPKFAVGQHVRISKERILFYKAYEQGWTDEIFRVREIKETRPVEVYIIEDLQRNVLNSKFYREELQAVPTKV